MTSPFFALAAGQNAMAKKKTPTYSLVKAAPSELPKVNANLNPASNFWDANGGFNIPGYGAQQPQGTGMFGTPQMQQLIQQAMQRFGAGGMQSGFPTPQNMPLGTPQPQSPPNPLIMSQMPTTPAIPGAPMGQGNPALADRYRMRHPSDIMGLLAAAMQGQNKNGILGS